MVKTSTDPRARLHEGVGEAKQAVGVGAHRPRDVDEQDDPARAGAAATVVDPPRLAHAAQLLPQRGRSVDGAGPRAHVAPGPALGAAGGGREEARERGTLLEAQWRRRGGAAPPARSPAAWTASSPVADPRPRPLLEGCLHDGLRARRASPAWAARR